MWSVNPFTNLTVFLSPIVMQVYIVLMILSVALGTVYDLLHGSKTKFFSRQRAKAKALAKKELTSGEKAAIAAKTAVTVIAVSGEFHERGRRISHMLMNYGFVFYLLTTIIMIFVYPTDVRTPVALPVFWNLGALMIIAGGYWFFFVLRVNVSHDGDSPLKLIRADLFIFSLISGVTFAILMEIVEIAQNTIATGVLFAFYIFFTTILFVTIPWSKFSHMFYKPGVAIQRRLEEASGSSDLPSPADGHNL